MSYNYQGIVPAAYILNFGFIHFFSSQIFTRGI